MSSYLIFGNGLLARELKTVLQQREPDAWVFMTSHTATVDEQRTTDIRNLREVAKVGNGKLWTTIFNTAAYTDVDGCEASPLLAMQVNALGAENVARLGESGRLVQFSTDAVFHADECKTEIDTPNPASVYGQSKLLGEHLVRQARPDAIVIRLANLYGDGGKSWASKLPNTLLTTSDTVVVDNARWVAPTWARWAAEVAVTLAGVSYPGGRLYHVCPKNQTTWRDFAIAVARGLGVETRREDALGVSRIIGREMAWQAPRGHVGALRSLLVPACGIVEPLWEDLLARYINSKRAT